MSETRVGHLRVTFTVMIALLFAITPLPASIEPARPGLLLLLVIYWSLSAPRIAGLTFAWLCGLAMDLLTGVVLGQHALAFLVVGFLTHKFQLRMRVFPIWHQTLTVFMLLALHQFLVFWIDGVVGQPITTWARWIPVLTGAMFWPALVAVLDAWNRRSR
ncbi:MAG TPA: rod shape-determining protein MreD [Steroidobacter sp.]|nr:rod shape-determining protein MreD [Steroidobacteraceae bacterium]HLS81542.1 rod shape-determining protein MreD [Steroidobacter sp.]